MTQASQNDSLDTAIATCKRHIEARLEWGHAAEWTAQDFEALSERIQSETGRTISSTTLKRIWGHVAYTSRPSQHSLTTLAAFLGYDSWRTFMASLAKEATADTPSPVASSPTPLLLGWRPYVFGIALLAVVAVIGWFWIIESKPTSKALQITSAVAFHSRPVTQGVPNTVIFEYDLNGVEADSFFIQQSWDPRRRSPILSTAQTHTAVYYYPGYFKAKLIANDSTLKEHPVHIKTEDWVITLEQAPIPEYVTKRNPASDGFLSVSKAWLTDQNLQHTVNEHAFSFFMVRDFGDLHTDDFTLETAVRREMSDARYACQIAYLIVMGEHNMLQVPFVEPGCVGAMSFMLGDTFVDGTQHDLSALGTNLTTWQPIRLRVENREVTIQVGDNPPYTQRFQMDVGHVVGLSYHFEGVGAIDYVSLMDDDGQHVYTEAF
ncbi:MAG: hypothetical protein RhofKO_14080 [Rhodothermales bacterium]